MFVVSNPGTGDVSGHKREARRNIGAFCRDLALSAPRISISGGDRNEDGRYAFTLRRGIRETVIDMPGLPLDRVRYFDGMNAWDFPRLYVDGNSWLWEFAIGCARDELLDHDGSAERGYEASRADCDFAIANESRCPTCSAVKDRYLSQKENPPYGYDRLRCLVCTPVTRTHIKSWDLSSVYMDDSWKRLSAGVVYLVTERLTPYEALGTQDDPDCVRRNSHDCRLRRGHPGQCVRRWEMVTKKEIRLPWKPEEDSSP